jgi:hypothetical protein
MPPLPDVFRKGNRRPGAMGFLVPFGRATLRELCGSDRQSSRKQPLASVLKTCSKLALNCHFVTSSCHWMRMAVDGAFGPVKTQNPVGVTPREGSIPSSGTISLAICADCPTRLSTVELALALTVALTIRPPLRGIRASLENHSQPPPAHAAVVRRCVRLEFFSARQRADYHRIKAGVLHEPCSGLKRLSVVAG